MILTETDITFSPERDGYPGIAIAFVIDNEVVYTKSFQPSFAENYLLNSPSIVASVDQPGAVVITSSAGAVEATVSEMLAAILLSSPLIIKLTLENGKHVGAGWRHDEYGFYVTTIRNGETVRYAGSGQYV
jgi:hypothetical protein